jgi:hypothetical protein
MGSKSSGNWDAAGYRVSHHCPCWVAAVAFAGRNGRRRCIRLKLPSNGPVIGASVLLGNTRKVSHEFRDQVPAQ